jgi:hypothetical protein
MAKMMKKSMKMAKAMKKSMKKMKAAKRVSVVAKGKRARASVFKGTKHHTQSGLKKTDLKKNKAGRIVSRKASDAARKRSGFKKIAKWGAAFKQARKALNIKGFCPCGGKTKQGQALLAKTRSLYKRA